VRPEFRGVARLCRDRFLTADILASMPLQAGGVEPSVFTCVFTFCPEGNQFVQVIHDAVLPQKLGGNIHN